MEWYSECLRLRPSSPSTLAALGFAYHASMRHADAGRGARLDAAIARYHAALSLAPDDSLTARLLTEALADALEYGAEDGDGGANSGGWVDPSVAGAPARRGYFNEEEEGEGGDSGGAAYSRQPRATHRSSSGDASSAQFAPPAAAPPAALSDADVDAIIAAADRAFGMGDGDDDEEAMAADGEEEGDL